MGGIGSGNRHRFGQKTTTEETQSLDVRRLHRECLSIEVERSITAEDVIGTLARLFRQRGEPAFIRSDNGPE